MRVLFMGSPDFALPSLNALAKHHQVVSVFTQPDRKAGRGRQLRQPPIKSLAQERGIPVHQPHSLKDQAIVELTKGINPDIIVVAAYGKILPEEILSIPKLGCINVHASLLPRWRGAAPIQAAIHAGDNDTGVSIMQMDTGLDTGPVFLQETTNISPTETGGELSQRLAQIGAEALIKALPWIESGELSAQAQDESSATYAPMLKKSDGILDFYKPASALALQVRAYEPWPSSFFILNNTRIVIREAEAIDAHHHSPGTCVEYKKFPAVSANPGLLLLTMVQPSGKKLMPGEIFLHGAKDFIDGRITNTTHASS
jgi:methionyl-tRNA formyltransferase